MYFLFFKQKSAYEMRISYWSSDVCSSDLRIKLPMPGHVESKNPLARCDFGIAKHMTVLPVIGASRMQADQWNTRSRFFDINAAFTTGHIERKITPDYGLESRSHACFSRPTASKSLMYCK